MVRDESLSEGSHDLDWGEGMTYLFGRNGDGELVLNLRLVCLGDESRIYEDLLAVCSGTVKLKRLGKEG